MIKRGRRLRINKEMRDLVRENILTANDFIFPIFVVEGNNIKKEISSLPGNYHVSLDRLNEIVDEVNLTKEEIAKNTNKNDIKIDQLPVFPNLSE